MRIAVVADIHGNRQAFEAVLEDLKVTSPDLVFHGGDLCDTGSSPVEVVDRIRDLGWPGVVGNTDELLFRPESLREFAGDAPHLQTLVTAIEEMAMYAREQLGMARLEWLRSLPRVHVEANVAIVHASPVNLWRAPTQDAGDSDLALTYGPLNRLVSIYGHIHHGFIREIGDKVIANTGSVGLPYDGIPVRRIYYWMKRGFRFAESHMTWKKSYWQSPGTHLRTKNGSREPCVPPVRRCRRVTSSSLLGSASPILRQML